MDLHLEPVDVSTDRLILGGHGGALLRRERIPHGHHKLCRAAEEQAQMAHALKAEVGGFFRREHG
jgi:hypothetical protein